MVATLYCEVFNTSPWNAKWTHETASRRLTEALETPVSPGLLPWRDARLMGGLVGYQEQWFDGLHFFLKEIFVAWDSQRQGIGTQLIHHLKRTLTNQGVDRTEKQCCGFLCQAWVLCQPAYGHDVLPTP